MFVADFTARRHHSTDFVTVDFRVIFQINNWGLGEREARPGAGAKIGVAKRAFHRGSLQAREGIACCSTF
jgi:hypothetical protein